MKIAIIGSGNIASFFANKIYKNYELTQIISKNIEHAKQLSSKYKCQYSNNLEHLNNDLEVIIFAVKDDVLIELSKTYSFQNKLVIHTAGSVDLDDIKSFSKNISCIWCIYSIQKDNLPTSDSIPLVVNANNETSLNLVKKIAASISKNIIQLSDEQKNILHLAAVFANNFTNHLYVLSKQICEDHQIPFDILKPIILNTAEKVQNQNPKLLQSGPAIRHDKQTMEKHLMLIQNDNLKKLYSLLSTSIQQKTKI